jgi:hypothetical protein
MATVRLPLRPWLCRLSPALLLLLGACASVGDYGYGYPDRGYPQQASRQDLVGEVRNVDHGNRRFLVQEQHGGRADIAYDERTRLVYQGREQPVAGLEPGDRVRVLASRDGGLWRAEDIEVLQDARGGGGPGDGYGAERRGAISYVDSRTREIGYTEGGYTGGEQRIGYDSRTLVEYRGQRYPIDALERGDLVRISLRRGERGWVADRILVEVSSRER